MEAIKKEEYPIKNNGFECLGTHYDCQMAIERDIEMILQEAETSHKDTFDELYDRNTLRPYKIHAFVDENGIPIYGMIVYIVDYKEGGGRHACGGYYPFFREEIYPHPFQESICW